MIIYSKNIKEFNRDISFGISKILNDLIKKKMFKFSGKSEIESWNSSLNYFSKILNECNLDENCTITLEYNLPMTSNRIDLILSGYDKNNKEKLIVFELKQWEKVNDVLSSDYLVETFINGGLRQVLHPGYQVWSYGQLLKDFNTYIQDNEISVSLAVLLHNYDLEKNDVLLNEKFDTFNKEVEIFGKNNETELKKYIEGNLSKGDNGVIISNIDNSTMTPSPKLQEKINSLIVNNDYFTLIDEQMEAFSKIVLAEESEEKSTIIVKGNPGTGKSVIAINLLNYFINKRKLCQYVSRNTAPRVIYSFKLKGNMKKSSIDNLFKSSGSYTETDKNIFDVLLVDEAHCLTEKSGLFNNYGENQIKEIINSSKTSVFFIDENQRVHFNDIGTIENIKKFSQDLNSKVHILNLESQFRCNNSNDYINFVDYLLGINDLYNGANINYDLKIIDSPQELVRLIKEKNKTDLSRVVAGYCWNWNKKEINNPDFHDIVIKDFEMSWNLGQGQTFAIDDSINEAGCIHSVQGLEFDYVGVIIGSDLKYRDGKVVSDFSGHGSADPSFKGIKKLYKQNYKKADNIADTLIKNAYRVLLTRGIKGCYIYCDDEPLREHLKNEIIKVIK